MSTIQSRILELMKSKGMTIAYVSQQIGVSHTTIGRIINGTQTPNCDTLCRLSVLLNVSMEYIWLGTNAHSLKCDNAQLCDHEKKLLHLFNQLDNRVQEDMIELIEYKIFKNESNEKGDENNTVKSSHLDSNNTDSEIA